MNLSRDGRHGLAGIHKPNNNNHNIINELKVFQEL